MKHSVWALCLTIAAAFCCSGCTSLVTSDTTASESSAASASDSTSSDSDSSDTSVESSSSDDSSTSSVTAGQTLSAVLSGEIGVEADEDDSTSTYDNFDAEITLADDATSISGDSDAVTVTGNCITISAGGTYRFTGTLSDGQILVTGEEKVKLYLDGVSITNSTGPALLCVNEKRTVLSLAAGTENTFSDGASYDAYTVAEHEIDPSAIYAQDKLTINGTGNLTINGNCEDGLICKDDLKLVGGTITVNAIENGIKGKDCVALFGADLIIAAGNDGLKSTETDDTTKGFLQLESGSAVIQAGGDCLQAESLVWISGGTFDLTSDGTAMDDTGESNSAKGIHCTGDIQIAGGSITIDTPEDGVHCDGSFLMEDGTMTIDTEADGIQAEGDLTQTGGDMTITTTGEVSSTTSFGDEFGGGGGGNGGFDSGFGGGGGRGMSYTENNSTIAQLAEVTMLEDVTDDSTDDNDGTSSKGIKCTGNLVMSGGTCSVTTTDHAVHATGSGEISGTVLNITSENKGISVHGNLTISDGTITINNATEGIESKADLLVSGGTIRILYASDDGINTGGTGDSHAMTFTGGYTYVCADGDGVDSNATLDISGGTLIVCGPTTGADGSIDFETTMTYTGGTLLALSYNGMMEYGDSGLLVTTSANVSAGEQISVVDADGNVMVTVTTPKAVSDVIYGIPNGSSDDYTILSGGTYSGTLNDDGVGTDGTISGGTEVTISASGSMGGGMQGGMGGNMGGNMRGGF